MRFFYLSQNALRLGFQRLRFLILFCLGSVTATAQTTYFVNGATYDNNDVGTSWATAFKGLQYAINFAKTGDSIFVKTGTYYPTISPDPTSNNPRDKTFLLKEGVKLYGGFAGTETSLSQRNFAINPTILNGDIGTVGVSTDNCYHVVLALSLSSATVIDGFSVINGRADGSTSGYPASSFNVSGKPVYQFYGGGMMNESGGGNSSPTVSNMVFSNNAGSYGGGMYNRGRDGSISSPTLTNVVFSNNDIIGGADAGASSGMYNDGESGGNSSPTLSNVVFFNNLKGGMFNDGTSNGTSMPIISNSVFINNGGVVMLNFAFNATGKSSPKIVNTVFYGNASKISNSSSGGGVVSIAAGSVNNADDAGTTSLVNIGNAFVNLSGVPAANIFISPTNPAGADGLWFTPDDGLQLLCSSLLKDAGTTTSPALPTDLIGYSRKGSYDIGAYENQGRSSLGLALGNTTGYASFSNASPQATMGGNCNDYCSITPSGTSPITGSISSSVTIDPTIKFTNARKAYVQRHYDIIPVNNASTSTATIVLYYLNSEFQAYNTAVGSSALQLPDASISTSANIANLTIAQFHGTSATGLPDDYTAPGGEFDIIPSKVIWNATNNRWEVTISVNGFSGFFAKAGSSSILPLTLIDFSGKNQGSSNLIQWKTVDELNTKEFVLERSTANWQWEAIGTIRAKGSGNGNYVYTDIPLREETAFYYRLKMVDKDGKYTYSNIIIITFATDNSIAIFPNPAISTITVNTSGNDELQVQNIGLYNQLGQKLQVKTLSSSASKMIISVENLASGIYYIKIGAWSKTFIKQ